jgi:glycosyltransferase involved in cell wall biosynthesis
MLITFLIITYRRPQKVARLLSLFLDDRWQRSTYTDFEIVVADDHSQDGTLEVIQPIIKNLVSRGWSVRYVCRDQNIRGDRNLFYGYRRDSKGMYVWFLCDDDVIDVGEAIEYISCVLSVKPAVSICGFTQGEQNQIGNRFEGVARVIRNFRESIPYLIKFPKTTAYMLRRIDDDKLDEMFEFWDDTLFSWIGISIYLLKTRLSGGLLIYPKIVARADQDFGKLRYSYRVFMNLYTVTKDALNIVGVNFKDLESDLKFNLTGEEIDLCVQGLSAHYNSKCYIEYSQEVLKAEVLFLKTNIARSVFGIKRCFCFSKLIYHFFWYKIRGL